MRITFTQAFRILFACVLCLTASAKANAQVNEGESAAEKELPFRVVPIVTFNMPWSIAVLPDGRMLVTEKGGRLFISSRSGEKRNVEGVPKVYNSGQNGLLDVKTSLAFSEDRLVYFSFVEPGNGGSGLALAKARLEESGSGPRLEGLQVIWRQEPKGTGNQPGGKIAFDEDGRHVYITSGDRRRPETAQDPESALGKVLRLNLDGSTPPDNPMAARGGVRGQTWTSGHRNPYGLAFAPDGQLWLHEMGPRGGDELNRLRAGRNYGWPIVSNGDNYDGSVIPDHATRPEFEAPVIYWTPVISPAGMAFYSGSQFPQWNGSALIGGLSAAGLMRVAFDSRGGARQVERWNFGQRIRDVAVAADGSVWVVEDGPSARLLRLSPR